MHFEAVDFLARIRLAHEPIFVRTKVIEAGSLDINGSARHFFTDPIEYIGVDWQEGKGVDVVSRFHEYRGRPDGHFDVAISTEMLEHDPHWAKSIRRMAELVRIGGSVLITCAGPGRAPHHLETAPDVKNHYQNLAPNEILDQLNPSSDAMWKFAWKFVQAEYDPRAFDTRVLAMGKLA